MHAGALGEPVYVSGPLWPLVQNEGAGVEGLHRPFPFRHSQFHALSWPRLSAFSLHTAAVPRAGLLTRELCGALAFPSSSFPLLITTGTGVISRLCLLKPSFPKFYVLMAALTPRSHSSKISGCILLILELKSDFREDWWMGRRTERLRPSITADLGWAGSGHVHVWEYADWGGTLCLSFSFCWFAESDWQWLLVRVREVIVTLYGKEVGESRLKIILWMEDYRKKEVGFV